MKQLIIPRYILFTIISSFFIWINLAIYRLITWKFFFPSEIQQLNSDILNSLYIGFKFDLRVSLWIIVPIFLFTLILKNYFEKHSWKRFNTIYFLIVFLLLNVFYVFDIGNYLYLNERITSSFLEFFKNPLISSQMLWESYPVIWIVLGMLILTWIQFKITKTIYSYFQDKIFVSTKFKKILYPILTILFIALGIYGKFSFYPLRWSEAYFSKNKDISQLTLNPVLNFINSFDYASTKADLDETKKYFPTIANYLGIENPKMLNFERTYQPLNDSIPNAKNIVVIMMESLGAAPLGIFGNPMNVSPTIDSLAKNSWFFEEFYVPRVGTARTVYASLTGLPDVVESKSASRIPAAVDQRIIFDQLKADKKLYFLGGSANWANIRALFTNNISGIEIYEEGSYNQSERADVWGIDDYNLFKKSSIELGKLHKNKKTFIAYIQTSAYHNPHTVPEKRGSFRPLKESEVDMKKLKNSGFISLNQLNSLRYFDYNLGQFFKFTKKEGFYDNTIFLMFGDHNGHVLPYQHMKKPEYETEFGQYHAMFMIHGKNSPKKRDTQIVSLIDIFPTVADLMNQKYTNYTLGRSILRRKPSDKQFAFVFKGYNGQELPGTLWKENCIYSVKKGNIVNPLYYYEKNKYSQEDKSKPRNFVLQADSLTKAMYHSTLYLYFNNKKNNKN